MVAGKKKSGNFGLWIPQRVLQMSFLSGDEKLYYAHIFSFAERGCWQTDEQIGKALGHGERSIQRYGANCRKAGLLKLTKKRSKYRRIWAKDHPKYVKWRKTQALLLRQKRRSRATKVSELQRQNRPTTNTYTNTGTNKGRGGSPSPAEQAHSPRKDKQKQLEEYGMKEDTLSSIEQLARNFGKEGRRTYRTEAECAQCKQAQQRALLAGGAGEVKKS